MGGKIRPPFKSVGGKYYLAPKLLQYLPPLNTITHWTEHFGRSAALTLAKQPSGIFEEYIELDGSIADLMRQIRSNCAQFVEQLRGIPYTQAAFWKHREQSTPIGTFVKLNMSRGGLGKDFSYSDRQRGGKPGDINGWATRLDMLPEVAKRLEDVHIVWGCGIRALELQNSEHHFHYLDPPYLKATRVDELAYGVYEMSDLDHERLAVAANKCPGKIMLSGYRCPQYDKWYSHWRRVDFMLPNHSGQTVVKNTRIESIWLNY